MFSYADISYLSLQSRNYYSVQCRNVRLKESAFPFYVLHLDISYLTDHLTHSVVKKVECYGQHPAANPNQLPH